MILCDTMGLEETADLGIDVDDIVSICKGHVKDRYQVSHTTTSLLTYLRVSDLNQKVVFFVYFVCISSLALLLLFRRILLATGST